MLLTCVAYRTNSTFASKNACTTHVPPRIHHGCTMGPPSFRQQSTKVPPRVHQGSTIVHCMATRGHSYSTLSWFTRSSNPSPSLVRKVRNECADSAVELENGDARTLALQGFSATPPTKPPPLFGSRKTLPTEFTSTNCKAVRPRNGIFLKARRAKADSTRKANQILWRVSELARTLDKKM